MRKKTLVVLLAIAMLFAFAASAYGFSDTNDHWAAAAIEKWSNAGVVKGYSDGTFKPDANITRAEFAAMLNRILEFSGSGASFKDVNSDAWYYKDVVALAKAGVVNGYEDGTFRPSNPITREEASAMFARAFGISAQSTDLAFSDAAKISAWALSSVAAMSEAHYINGYPDNTFRPQGLITRSEVVTIINNASTLAKISGYLNRYTGGNVTPVTPGKSPLATEEPSVDNIVKIQPYSALTYYGVGLVKVEITYEDDVDLSDVDLNTYVLQDRGNLSADFGALPIADVQVRGHQVVILIDRDTTANASNARIYSGDAKTGSRAKDNVYGLHATSSWYRENSGIIIEGNGGYQYRELELKLYHNGEKAADALCQANAKGVYDTSADNKFAETEIEYFTSAEKASFKAGNETYNYSKNGFMTFEDLGIRIQSSSGLAGDFVLGYVAFPDNYDPAKSYPLIMSLPGGGTALWEKTENGKVVASNPYGPTFFDGSAISWYAEDAEAIVIYMDHRYSLAGSSVEGTPYSYVEDDLLTMNYFIDHYGANENHVILTGNSMGTIASSNFIKEYPERISTFICCNGDWGINNFGIIDAYTDADYATAASYGLSVWCFDGEQDSNNIPSIGTARAAYKAAGFSEAEIADMLRHSGIDTDYNYYWGETDHSVTKFVYWYLLDNQYKGTGSIKDAKIVYDNAKAATYQLDGTNGVKKGYDYTVYGDTLLEWALSDKREIDANYCTLTQDDIVSVQPYSELTYYGVGLVKVDITYKAGTDLSGVNTDYYHLWDRGNLTSDFGEFVIESATVKGNVVTLTIERTTTANADNALIYAGDNKTGSRTKDNVYGLHATSSWYRQVDGKLMTGGGYQFRELELKLYHAGERFDQALSQCDAKGVYQSTQKFLPTEIEYFTTSTVKTLANGAKISQNGFKTFAELGIVVPSTSGIDNVLAYVSFPDNYDVNRAKPYPLILSLPGGGTALWDKVDESGNIIASNPYGPTFFDGSAISWVEEGADAIVIYLDHRYNTRAGSSVYGTPYSYIEDDMRVIDYFIDNFNANIDHVILTGNSQGTVASSQVIAANPQRISTFICCNGDWGINSRYTENDYLAAASYGLSVWCLDGEQDSNNIPSLTTARGLYAKFFDEATVADKLRHSGIDSNYNYYWGETDHSVTKFVYWYMLNIYYYGTGKIVDGAIKYDSTTAKTYQLDGKLTGTEYNKKGYDYSVYTDQTLMEWALNEDRQINATREPYINMDAYTPATHDYSESNQLPNVGYYKDTVDGKVNGREVRWYIPDTAIIRPYYHMIAIPDGVEDIYAFLEDTGWKALADSTGECLFVLVPDQETLTWGALIDEVAYITAARSYHGTQSKFFTTFGLFYLTGYEEGAAPLEAWAAENPQLVISQAYIGGASVGSDILTAAGNSVFGWGHMTDGDRRIVDGKRLILDQITAHFDNISADLVATWGDENGLMKKSAMAVPTYFINAKDSNDLAYWLDVNKAENVVDATIDEGLFSGSVYGQDGDTWTTQYSGPISEVATLTASGDVYAPEFTALLRDELTDYTRYDSTISYGNALNYRVEGMTDIQVARYTDPSQPATGRVSGITLEGNEIGADVTIEQITLDLTKYPDLTFTDATAKANGEYVSDLLLYVPDTAVEKYADGQIPVVIVWHGGSQTGHLFFESTMWWQTAAEEGFAIILPTRTNHNSGTSANYDLPLFDAIVDYLGASTEYDFDLGRIYATGQSMGGIATTSCACYRAEQVAAAYATNVSTAPADAAGVDVPMGLTAGEANYAIRGIPGFKVNDVATVDGKSATGADVTSWHSDAAAAAGADVIWDAAGTNAETGIASGIARFTQYFCAVNGVDEIDDLSDTILYSGSAKNIYGGTDGPATISSFDTNTARFRVFNWTNEQDIPVVQYLFALYEAHNCLPGYRPIIWDFFEHYRVDLETGIRYYSADGSFNDEVAIDVDDNDVVETRPAAQTLTEQLAPVNNPEEANQLEVTGYFTAPLTGDFANREVRIYIPETAILRPYFHFIAVPSGVNVDEFLEEAGWFQVADETGECLYILMPDQATNAWGDPDAEKDYITAARAYHQASGKYFTTFGIFYLTGYGEGAAPLEAWAAENPQLVCAQAYIGGASYDAAKLTALGEVSFGWGHMTDGDRLIVDGKRVILDQITGHVKDYEGREWGDENGLMVKADMAVPTWLINSDQNDLAYWQGVNQAEATVDDTFASFAGQAVTAQVYGQDKDTWTTQYAGQISKVTTIDGVNPASVYTYEFTNALRDTLTDYSRYDSTICYGNALNWRIDYTALQVERFATGEDTTGTVEATLRDGSTMNGEMTLVKRATPDTGATADILLYVPQSALDADAPIPVVVVHHGGSQNGHLFFDTTMWWQTAADNGFAIIFSTRTTNGSGAKAPSNIGSYQVMLNYLEELDEAGTYDFDFERIFTTGQSAGAGTTMSCATDASTVNTLAAAYCTNAAAAGTAASGISIPMGMIVGEANYDNRGIPGFTATDKIEPGFVNFGSAMNNWTSSTASAVGATITWDPVTDAAGNPSRFGRFVEYFCGVNGVDGIDDLSPLVQYSGSNKTLYGGTDGPGTVAQFDTNNARFRTFNWLNEQNVPVVEYSFAFYEAHNCLPGFRDIIWDYFEHFRIDLDTTTRYYSADGTFNDEIAIDFDDNDVVENGELAAAQLDIQLAPVNNPNEGNQLEVTGYFFANLTGEFADREIRYYVPETAILRPYFHMIAVPSNVNITEFLAETGWIDVADATGECLFILLPDQNTGVWGDPADEKDYITAARNFHASSASTKYFTTFGLFYLTGYEDGAAGLEGWAAENPQLVISQAYLGGQSYGAADLAALGAESFGWGHPTDGDRRVVDGKRLILDQMSERLTQVDGRTWGDENAILLKQDMAVPTFLINRSDAVDLAYWLGVNKAENVADKTVGNMSFYYQDEDTWTTQYAGKISQVVTISGVADAELYAPEATRDVRDMLTQYSRYDSTICYGNALNYRVDYTALQVERFTEGYAKGTVTGQLDAEGNTAEAEMTLTKLTTPDNGATTDVLLYVPESAIDAAADGTPIPVVVVHHGGSQNGHLFFECTMWWQTAAKEGFALILNTRTTNGSGAKSPTSVGSFDAMVAYLTELDAAGTYDFDLTRIYTTGQSAGGAATVACAQQRSYALAAAYGTDGGTPSEAAMETGKDIPYGLCISEGNYSTRGIPGYEADATSVVDGKDAKGADVISWHSATAAADGADIVWDATVNATTGAAAGFALFTKCFFAENGIDNSNLSADVLYRGSNAALYGGTDGIGTVADFDTNNARFRTFNWEKTQDGLDIPVLQYTLSLYQAHNCVPGYRPIIWDFFEHYSIEQQPDGNFIRYYSDDASFSAGHKVAIDFAD